jgi:hypothetical protein
LKTEAACRRFETPAMSDYDRTLSQVREIHAHLARGEVFRGWHWLTAAGTAALALGGALLQERLAPSTTGEFAKFWVAVAGIAGALALVDILVHVRRYGRPATARLARSALFQFAPAAAAGAGLAVALAGGSAGIYLPGLWSIVFGLGLAAARPHLPRGISGVVAFHLVAGIALLMRAEPGVMPSSWDMGGVFGLGQALLALVLHTDITRFAEGADHD